jgi:putative oxidoreductase
VLKDIIQLKAIPPDSDLGLLILRLTTITPLFLKHGIEKIFTFSQMAAHFPDPLHIGPVPSLAFAMISDSICTLLMIFGIATRWAAAIVFVNVFVAWALVHHFQFFGHAADHGELIVLYLGVTLTLFFSGPGRYSFDGRGSQKS